MFAAALSEIKSLVDKRFLLNAFFPWLAITFGTLLLVATGNGGVGRWIDVWQTYSVTVQALVVLGVAAGLFVVAAITVNFAKPITQLYEGYLLPSWMQGMAYPWQRFRKAHMRPTKRATYFSPIGLRATALGNIMGAAEDYPKTAYGAESLTVWPRLFLLLTSDFLASMASTSDTLQFLLNVSMLSALFAVGGGVYIAVEALGRGLFLAVVFGGGAVSFLTYQGALHTAVGFGLHLRGAFDLHRNEVLKALRRPLPATSDEEMRLWKEVSRELAVGAQWMVRYSDSPEP